MFRSVSLMGISVGSAEGRARRGPYGGAAVLSLGLTACCGPSAFLLQEPPPPPPAVGSYVCAAANGGCHPDPTTDEARFNQSGTVQITLPPDCKYRIRRILIQNAHSSEPTVIVECTAPPSDGIPTTELPPKP